MIKLIKKLFPIKRENAQTMVEFALVFPIVLLITYGIMEFGRMIFIYAAVTGSAREGARYGAAAGDVIISGKLTPRYADCAGIRNAVRGVAFFVTIPDSKILIRYDEKPGGSAIAGTCEALVTKIYNNEYPIDLGDRIVVHVTGTYTPIIRFLGFNGFDIPAENARTILVDIPIQYP